MHKKHWATAAIAVIISLCFVAVSPAAGKAMTDEEKVSYGIGANQAKSLKGQFKGLNLEMYLQGFKDGYSGGKEKVSAEEFEKALEVIKTQMAKEAEEKSKVDGEKNRKAGEAFLAENVKKPGVKVLPSGLQYKEVKAGAGKTPTMADKVTVHYKGTLIDGTEFDSSYKRNKPAEFPLNGVIKGFSEALINMKEGSKWTVYIPSNLAYGENAPPSIGPNSTLIFELELIKIN